MLDLKCRIRTVTRPTSSIHSQLAIVILKAKDVLVYGVSQLENIIGKNICIKMKSEKTTWKDPETAIALDNMDASTLFNIQMQYFTKFNTTGYSEIVSINTSK